MVGTPFCLLQFDSLGALAVLLAAVNTVLCVYLLKLSRIAFIVLTVISLNPILWVAHWIYLRNRWDDPRILENSNKQAPSPAEVPLQDNSAAVLQTSTVKNVGLAGGVGQLTHSPEDTDTDQEEMLWERAMREVESDLRRPGLWAKCFAEAHGAESAAKARYISARVGEMRADLEASARALAEAELRKAEELRLSEMPEEMRAYELLPKGTCPCCEVVLPLSSIECPKCKALFGPDSAWSIKPLPPGSRPNALSKYALR